MPLLRSRQPKSENASGTTSPLLVTGGNDGDKEANKGNTKSFFERNKAQMIIILGVSLCCIYLAINIINTNISISLYDGAKEDLKQDIKPKEDLKQDIKLAPMGSIIYGAKSKGGGTAKLVKEAIQSGFRHIATGGFHNEYNEAGVGEGWKESGIPRNELYLQTLYLARSVNGYKTQNCNLEELCPLLPDSSLEQHVHISIKSSLQNLQTHYIDSVLVHNFRAKLQPYEETLQVWKVLQDYVDQGVIRHLGIVSVHDKDYLTQLHSNARIKPTIIQNRFHSNRGYDINLRPMFKELGMANQLFWILTGSSGGSVRNNDLVKGIADKKGVSPQILLYSFTMELGGSPLIGTKSITHMREDVDALITHKLEWEREDLVAMAGVINKHLAQ